jgi:OOP family OmpA-OmpF porin
MVCLSIVIMPKVLFAPGADVPLSASQATIDAAFEALRDNPRIRIVLEGHRDGKEEPYGRKLSLKRAEKVRDLLVGRGIDSARLCVQGFGETRPLTPSTTADQRAKNRRVEFRVLESGESCP